MQKDFSPLHRLLLEIEGYSKRLCELLEVDNVDLVLDLLKPGLISRN